MQPFDERIPEENKQENEALIAFLRRTYRYPADIAADERKQVLARVRERLLGYDETEMAERQLLPLSQVERKIVDGGPSERNLQLLSGRSGKSGSWGRSMRMMMAVAVVFLLVGSMAVLLQVVKQKENGLGHGATLPVLTELEGTGGKTFSALNLVVPKGKGVGIDFSCDGRGRGSVALYNKYPLLSDSGGDDWDHPTILSLTFDSCSLPMSGRAGGGPYTLSEVRISTDVATSWKVKIISFPVAPPPNLHLPTLSLPNAQIPIGEFAGSGTAILFPSAYALPIQFQPDRPWQLHLVCRGPGMASVELDLGKTYQPPPEYTYHPSSQVIYTVPCSASASVNASQLFPPSLNVASNEVTVAVAADVGVKWDWILGWCTGSTSAGCQPSHEKP